MVARPSDLMHVLHDRLRSLLKVDILIIFPPIIIYVDSVVKISVQKKYFPVNESREYYENQLYLVEFLALILLKARILLYFPCNFPVYQRNRPRDHSRRDSPHLVKVT